MHPYEKRNPENVPKHARFGTFSGHFHKAKIPDFVQKMFQNVHVLEHFPDVRTFSGHFWWCFPDFFFHRAIIVIFTIKEVKHFFSSFLSCNLLEFLIRWSLSKENGWKRRSLRAWTQDTATIIDQWCILFYQNLLWPLVVSSLGSYELLSPMRDK